MPSLTNGMSACSIAETSLADIAVWRGIIPQHRDVGGGGTTVDQLARESREDAPTSLRSRAPLRLR
jgi:hypothetical protein